MPKKVLIAHAYAGMGHIMAARAIEEAFLEKYPDAEVRNVNIIDLSIGIYKTIYCEGYAFLSEKLPKAWGLFYKYLDSKLNQKVINTLSKIAMDSKFLPYIREFNPDFIIATYPLAMRLISLSGKKDIINIPSAMVITDFGFHSFWVDKETDYYFVATNELCDKLSHAGIEKKSIVVSGIPIRKQFSKIIQKDEFIRGLGLKESSPIFLIIGGQFEFLTLEKVVAGVRSNVKNAQFIIISGRHDELKKSLDASFLKKLPEVKIFEFVKNIEDFMAIASLIFTKAGGLTITECLAMGAPMIIHKIIPGQEEANVEYCVRMGAAVKVETLDELISRASSLLGNPQEIIAMKKACLKLGKPHAASDIADFVYNKIDTR